MPTSLLPMTPALVRRLIGSPLLFLLDVDGTLSPIAPRPAEATVPEATRRVLTDLAAMPGVHVAIVSGRSADDALRLVGVDGLWAIGNHGIEVAAPHRPPTVREDIAPFADQVAAASAWISDVARDLPGVLLEDKRWTASVHYRLADEAIVPGLTARVVQIASEHGLVVKHAKKTLELRPPVQVDKGTAALELAALVGATASDASVLAAGDDLTDEDMFSALRVSLPGAVTVWVAHDSPTWTTAAEFSVPDTDALRDVLNEIAHRRSGGSLAKTG
jgi:trehalose-phosphatase